MICTDNVIENKIAKKIFGNSLLAPDWTTLDIDSPYFDGKKYFITVDLEIDIPSKNELESLLAVAKEPGVKGLLDAYGKINSNENVQKLVQIAQVFDWFVPERPNPRCEADGKIIPLFPTKVLIAIEAKELNKIPSVPTATKVNLPVAKQEINLFSNEIKEKLHGASKKLEHYDNLVSNIKGSLSINLSKESERLKGFASALENLLIANGFSLRKNSNDLIILGIDENYKILYVLIDNGKKFVQLTTAFSIFLKNKSVKNDRTIKYLSHLDDLNDLGNRLPDLSLEDFFKSYTLRMPNIKIGGQFEKFNIDKSFSSSISTKDIINKANKTSVKSEEDKKNEDVLLASPSLKATISSENKNKVDFVGDVTLSVPNFSKLLNKLNSLEDVYEQILNKVSLQEVILMALKCLPIPEPCVLAISFLKNLKIDKLINILKEKANIDLTKIVVLEPLFRAGFIECITNLDVNEQAEILNIISVKANLQVRTVADLNTIPLQHITDALEVKGLNLIKNILDTQGINLIFSPSVLQELCINLTVQYPNPDPSLPALNFDLNFNIDLDVSLSEIPKFEIPTISFEDILPTADIMASITTQIEASITDALVVALVDMIKNIIKGILENCGDITDKNYGSINIKDLLAKSVNVNVNTEAFANITGTILKNSLEIGSSVLSGNFINFLDDLSALLSVSEISDLLSGNVSEQTEKIINCLTNSKYSGLKGLMDNPSKVEDLFSNMGSLVDKELLFQQISLNNNVFGTTKDICEPPDESGRRKLLASKGLNPDLIDEQVAKANKRKIDRLSNFVDLLNKNKPLNNVIPSIFCKDKNSSSLIKRDHPSFDHVLNKTTDVIYDGVHVSFNQEIASFPASLKEGISNQVLTEVPRVISTTDVNGNTVDIINPEVSQLVASGVSVSDFNQDINQQKNLPPVKLYKDKTLSDGGTEFVVSNLKKNLDEFKFDSTNTFNKRNGAIKIIVPNTVDPGVLSIPQSTTQSDLEKAQNALGSLNLTKQSIEYIPSISTEKDEYRFVIKEKNNISNETIVFDITESKELSSTIQNFVTNKNLDIFAGSSLPQSYFSSMVAKIWKDKIGTPANISTIDGDFREKVKTEIFSNIFIDLFGATLQEVSRSNLFSTKILSLINFTPPVQQNGCQPHLLNLDSIKKNMKDSFKNSECEEDGAPSEDGLGKENLNSLEKSGVEGATRTLIRLYVIELLLRTIFVFSKFKIQSISDVDSVTIKYFIEFVKKEISKLGSLTNDIVFVQQFQEQVIKLGKENSYDSSLEKITKEELSDVMGFIADLINFTEKDEISNIILNEWLPLFEVANGSLRLSNNDFTNLKSLNSILSRNNVLFDLSNGNFILERYIRTEDKNRTSQFQLARNENSFGITNIKDFSNFISTNAKNLETTNKIHFENEFSKLFYGLRLVYVPAVGDFETTIPGRLTPFVQNEGFVVGLDLNSQSVKQIAKEEKIIKIFEGTNTNISGEPFDVTKSQTRREIHSFPIVSIEIEEERLDLLTTDSNLEQNWLNRVEILKQKLKDSPEFHFCFDFCFPIKRMISLAIMYNVLYVSNIKNIQHLFDGTKTNLKMVFQALLNSGNYKYDDKYIQSIGGTTGLNTQAQNNTNTSPEIPGLSLTAIAARTPFLILKGLVELTDINIGRARKITDLAKDNGKNIPVQVSSMAQLPMNVFPPPPLGPGIGAPITPLGFLYLALNIDDIFDSAKGKENKRQELIQTTGLNLNSNLSGSC